MPVDDDRATSLPNALGTALARLPLKAASRAWQSAVDAFRVHVLRSPVAIEHRRYARDAAEITYLVDHPLDSTSVVFDVGAHVGNWLARIIQRYDPVIHTFEVHPRFCDLLERRFGRNPKVTIHRCGLGFPPRTELFAEAGPATTARGLGPSHGTADVVACTLADPSETISRLAPQGVSLMAMNIEGAEYEVLERILDSGCIVLIRDLMVQFHDVSADSAAHRERIRGRLEATHFVTFRYGDFWENWRRR